MSGRVVQKRQSGSAKAADLLEESLKTPLPNPLKKHRRIVASLRSQRCGSFSDVRTEVLQSAEQTEVWRQAAHRTFGTLGSEADRLTVQAAAVHALRLGDNPSALFIETLRHSERITDADEDEGRRRLRELGAVKAGAVLAKLGIDAHTLLQRIEPS